MRFRLLGAVQLRADDRPVDSGPPRQRAVLAVLAADAGMPVLINDILVRVWGDQPPEKARDALYVYISKLRRLFETEFAADPAVRLRRRSGGYLLDIEQREVDVHRFRLLIKAGTGSDRDAAERFELLSEAMALWSGEPLADLESDWAAQTRDAWNAARARAAVSWAQLAVSVRRADEVVEVLGALAMASPFDESLAAALMRALFATGRRADALDHYASLRASLTDQLGVDPSSELQRLHMSMLRDEIWESNGADARKPADGRVTPALPVPAQLPAAVRGFTGRTAEFAILDTLLAEADGKPGSGAIAVLSGTAGVGKTALANTWARSVADRFPDGQLYVELHGFGLDDAVRDPADVLRGFLVSLGAPPQRLPAGVEECAAMFRSMLAGRRMLVVLDNARDAAQVRNLLPSGGGCFALVTSRRPLVWLVTEFGARPVPVQVPGHAQARSILLTRLERGAARAPDQRLLDGVVTACARLPLALSIVAARVATDPRGSLEAIGRELVEHPRLDALAGDETGVDVRRIFSWSYHALSPATQRLFLLFALLPGLDVGGPSLASLAGMPTVDLRGLLEELVRAQLVTETPQRRYTMHDLLRAYAVELAESDLTADERGAANRRLLDHLVHSAVAASALLSSYRKQPDPGTPAEGVVPEMFDGLEAATAWFAAEHLTLLAAVKDACRSGTEHAWRLAWALGPFLEHQGLWHDWQAIQQQTLQAAADRGDVPGQAHGYESLGDAATWLTEFDAAAEHYARASELYRRTGAVVGQARVHLGQALLAGCQEQYEFSLAEAQRALVLFVQIGHRTGEANALNVIGWTRVQLGLYAGALAACRRALLLHQSLSNVHGEAATLDSLGVVHDGLGNHAAALNCFGSALDFYRRVGHRGLEAEVLAHIGDSHASALDIEAANEAWRSALRIFDDLDHSDADEIRAKLTNAQPA